MEYKKGMMKIYLAENLRELMLSKPFEKITIKNICDKTGVIRATFYNYYDDKFDCLNSILYHDLYEESLPYLSSNDASKLNRNILNTIYKNKEFYLRGYHLIDTSIFNEMITTNIALILKEFFKRHRLDDGSAKAIDNETLANFYAESFAYEIKMYITKRMNDVSIDDFATSFELLTQRPFISFIK